MEIKIDHKVVRELMDNDPQFRAQVKRAVLDTALKHETFKCIGADTRQAIQDYAVSASNQWIIRERSGDKPHLTDELQAIIHDQFMDDLRSELNAARDRMQAQIQGEMAMLREKLINEVHMQVLKEIQLSLGRLIEQEVQSRLSEVYTKILEISKRGIEDCHKISAIDHEPECDFDALRHNKRVEEQKRQNFEAAKSYAENIDPWEFDDNIDAALEYAKTLKWTEPPDKHQRTYPSAAALNRGWIERPPVVSVLNLGEEQDRFEGEE